MNSGNVFFACSSVPYVWVYVTSGENRTDTNHYTMAKKSLEPCCRLDVVLRWYATSSGHRTISSLFGVGLVQCMWPSVQSCFKGQPIQACHLPAERETTSEDTRWICRARLSSVWRCYRWKPNVTAPRDDADAYYDPRGWYSITLQGVVDHNFW